MKTNLDTKGWEQRFEEKFIHFKLPKERMININTDTKVIEIEGLANDLKTFFRQELSLAKQQWIEEIGKMKETENMIKVCDDYSDILDERIHFDDGYTLALDEVLSYLKKLPIDNQSD